MKRNLSIACIQYSSSENEKHTLETIKDLIYKAVDAKAELITLPECATSIQKNSALTKALAKTESKNPSLQTLKEKSTEDDTCYIYIYYYHSSKIIITVFVYFSILFHYTTRSVVLDTSR